MVASESVPRPAPEGIDKLAHGAAADIVSDSERHGTALGTSVLNSRSKIENTVAKLLPEPVTSRVVPPVHGGRDEDRAERTVGPWQLA
jgi:hypothetical protein